jgi:hypothetical protein
MPGIDTVKLRKAALALARGGVGCYPRSGFIHLDARPPSAVVFRLPRQAHCRPLTRIRITLRKSLFERSVVPVDVIVKMNYSILCYNDRAIQD